MGKDNSSTDQDGESRGHVKQIVAVQIVSLWHLNIGSCAAIPSTILYSLERGSEGLSMSLEEATLAPSLHFLGNVIGSFASGYVSTSIGRKWTLLGSGLPLALSWLIMGLSTNNVMLYVSSFCQGIFIAIPWTSVGAYITEITEKHLRKRLGLCQSLQLSIGILISNCLGYFFGWRFTCLVMVAITGISSILILVLPETPYWLIEKDRQEEALKSLTFFRGGDNEDVRKELLDIVDAKEAKDNNRSLLSYYGTPTSKEFWKPFSCVGVIFILFRLSCFSILSHYTAPFLDRAGISMDPLLAAVLIGIFRLVFSLIAFIMLSFTSKRNAFILAGATSTLAMLVVSIYSHLLEALSPTPEWLVNKDWIPLVGFFIVTACHPLLMGIVLILVGEIFPTDIRTVSIGIVNGLQFLVLAFVTKTFPVLLEWLHFYGLNYYYAAFSLALTIWGMMTIIDIDGLSLVEIERIYTTRMDKSEGSNSSSGYGSFRNIDDTY